MKIIHILNKNYSDIINTDSNLDYKINSIKDFNMNKTKSFGLDKNIKLKTGSPSPQKKENLNASFSKISFWAQK